MSKLHLNIHKHFYIDFFIQTTFVFLFLTSFLYMLHENALPQDSADTSFHYHQIYEIMRTIFNGHLPQFNNYVGSFYGIAMPTFYPWLIFLPLSPLFLCMTHFHFVLLLYNLVLFASLESAYFCSRTYFDRKLSSYLFALFYVISSCELSFILLLGNLSSTCVYIFMPMVFFGWLDFIHNDKYKLLLCGLILLVYAHILEALLAALFICVLILLSIHHLNKHKWFIISKSIIIYMLCSAIIWLPIAILMLSNHIYKPILMGKKAMLSQLLPANIEQMLIYMPFCIIDIITIALAICYWKSLSYRTRKIFLIGIGILCLYIQPINSFVLTYTPLKIIQFLLRFAPISHILFTYVLIIILIKIILPKLSVLNFYSLIVTFISIVVMVGITEYGITYHMLGIPSLINVTSYYHNDMSRNDNFYYLDALEDYYKQSKKTHQRKHIPRMFQHFKYYSHLPIHDKHMFMEIDVGVPFMINANISTKYRFIHNTSYQDYAPENVGKHTMYYPFYPIQKRIHFINQNIIIKSKNNRIHWIPYATYNNQKYTVINQNNHKLPDKIKHHLIYVHLHKGVNQIKVITPVMWYRWLAMILTIIGWICYII